MQNGLNNRIHLLHSFHSGKTGEVAVLCRNQHKKSRKMKKQKNRFQIKVKNEDSLRNLCDIIKWTNIHIKAFTRREEGETKKQKVYSKKQRLKTSLTWGNRHPNPGSLKNSKWEEYKETHTEKHYITKLSKVRDKKSLLTIARKK